MSVEKWIPIKEETPAVDERLAAFSSPCENKEPYVLMVLGDSMAPEFSEGDIVVIEPHNRVGDGSYVIAWHKEEYVFRKLRIIGERFFLEAENPNYPAEQIAGLDQVKGVITQRKGKGRHNRKNYT